MHFQPPLNTFSSNNNNQNPPNQVTSSLNLPQEGGLIGNTSGNLQTGGQPTHPTPNSRSLGPTSGTVDYIGKNKIRYVFHRQWGVFSISAVIMKQNLDELRMADYFHLKNDTLPAEKKQLVLSVINENIRKRDAAQNLGAQFSANRDLPSGNNQLGSTAPLASGNLFVSSQASITGNLSENIQKIPQIGLSTVNWNQGSSIDQKNQNQKQPVQLLNTEKPQAQPQKNSSFGYEMNKMLFFSGLVQLMEKHYFSVPENILDNPDFVSQLLEFLEQENVSFPTENIPQFQIDSSTPLDVSPEENSDE